MEKNKAKPVGIWIRVSTEDQAHGESPEHHEKRARYYAESKDWKVKEVYHLEAVSGKSVKDHPETKRMLKDIECGHITGLIFSKLARLARNTRELLDFADFFREHNADLISLQESIDTSTPAGRLFYTMIAAMAQWEREEIAERVAASVPIRAKLGKSLGGAAPFGYRKEGAAKRLVPDPKEASVRRLMHELFLEHKRVRTVARFLNDAGHRTRNGSKFTNTTVERLLQDPTAKGTRRANYTKSLGDKKRWSIKPEKDWVWSKVEPIVSEELWNQCNLILAERKNGKTPSRRPFHLFTNIVHCHCGQKMYVPSNTPKYVCYKCRNKIPIVDLEGVFQEQLKNFFLSPKEMTGYLKEADETIKAKEELAKTLEKEQQKLKSEMDKIMRLYLDDKITPDGFGAQYRPLEERSKQVNEQFPQLQGELDFLKIKFISSDEVLTEAKDLYSRWPSLEPEAKRKIIENITDRITIGKDDVTIDLCYLPSSSEMMVEKSRNLKGSSRRPA
jgi:site-specific DNA recombinase